jgi:hypothetical protein
MLSESQFNSYLDALASCVTSRNSLETLYGRVKELAAAGVQQKDMLHVLETLRGKLPADHEDIVLEVMDCVSGFCQSQWRIYPQLP